MVGPIRIWMTEMVGGYIEVSEHSIAIKFPWIASMSLYAIEATSLLQSLPGIQKMTCQTIGELIFWSHKMGENKELMVVIEPEKNDPFEFQFEVSLEELRDVLVFLVG